MQSFLLWTLLYGFAVACGQDPSFLDIEKSSNSNAIGAGNRDASAKGGEGDVDNPGERNGGVLGDVTGNGTRSDNGTPDNDEASDENDEDDGEMKDPDEVEIPNADEDELAALHKCMEKWGQVPFPSKTYVRKIHASVVVGGIGNAINDTERTQEPELVLVSAAVNVGGAPVYQLLNPNGYYCIKVNVNVFTTLNINLHCNARLADSKVGVNIGSVMNDDTSTIGVHVASQISVNTIRPTGDECIR